MLNKINKTRSKKLPLLIGAIVLICLALGGIYWYSHMKTADNQLTQKQKSEAQTSNPKKSSDKDGSSSDGSGQVATPPTPAPVAPNATLLISSFSQANHTVQATATVSNATAGGSCYFAFSADGSKPVVQTTGSSTSSSNQICTFSSSEVAFDKVGPWQLKVTYSTGTSQVEGSQNVTIQ